jgi:hypothetical protein
MCQNSFYCVCRSRIELAHLLTYTEQLQHSVAIAILRAAASSQLPSTDEKPESNNDQT